MTYTSSLRSREAVRQKDWRITRRDFLRTAALASITGLGFGHHAFSEQDIHVRFGIVTDTHYADAETRGSRFYRESLPKLRECVDQMNQQQVDFLIELGDFKDQDNPPDENRTLIYLESIETALQQFDGPTYHVLGNHDMDSLSKSQFLERVTNTDIPRTESWYSFDTKGVHFVVLDANFRADGVDYDHGNFDWTDANLSPDQMDWLRQDLGAANLPTVVFVHQLLDGEGSHYLTNAVRVRTILEESGKVLAVFQGHQHAGQYQIIQAIHYYTLQAMVEGTGAENSAYAIVDLDQRQPISVTGYGKVASQELT